MKGSAQTAVVPVGRHSTAQALCSASGMQRCCLSAAIMSRALLLRWERRQKQRAGCELLSE